MSKATVKGSTASKAKFGGPRNEKEFGTSLGTYVLESAVVSIIFLVDGCTDRLLVKYRSDNFDFGFMLV